jgi:hypothetical protein
MADDPNSREYTPQQNEIQTDRRNFMKSAAAAGLFDAQAAYGLFGSELPAAAKGACR